MFYRIALLCLLFMLNACEQRTEKTPPPKLFEEQRKVLDQAKTVDPEQLKHDDEQRKSIEQQTQ